MRRVASRRRDRDTSVFQGNTSCLSSSNYQTRNDRKRGSTCQKRLRYSAFVRGRVTSRDQSASADRCCPIGVGQSTLAGSSRALPCTARGRARLYEFIRVTRASSYLSNRSKFESSLRPIDSYSAVQ